MRMGEKERLVANIASTSVSCWSKRGETTRGQTDLVSTAKTKPIKIGLDLGTQSSTRGEWTRRGDDWFFTCEWEEKMHSEEGEAVALKHIYAVNGANPRAFSA
jgi:hypothetical protein